MRGDALEVDLLTQTLQEKFVLLRGANGSGKTTLLRKEASKARREKGPAYVCYMGHQDGLKPHLTVEESLSVWQKMLSCSQTPLFEDAGLSEVRLRYISELSFGQKRRVCLARLQFVKDRPVWILDEPDMGLDEDALLTLRARLQQQLSAGGHILMASHRPGSFWNAPCVINL